MDLVWQYWKKSCITQNDTSHSFFLLLSYMMRCFILQLEMLHADAYVKHWHSNPFCYLLIYKQHQGDHNLNKSLDSNLKCIYNIDCSSHFFMQPNYITNTPKNKNTFFLIEKEKRIKLKKKKNVILFWLGNIRLI